MADFFDRAAAREAEILADHIAEQRRRAGLEGKTAADSAEQCVDCGGLIPQARREAYPGSQRCVECQTLHERREGVGHAKH